MEMNEITASDIGKRITVSYPDSGTSDQVTGKLSSVSHHVNGDSVSSEIAVKVAGVTYPFRDVRKGPWALDLKLL